MVGRRRVDFDQHKDLIIKLYHEKTPWSKIEGVLLNEHGCRVKSRTIMRRFKESYWEDRSTRPKTDEELLQKLLADGFTVSLSAIIQIRKDMNLYRRWDERLGRYRPDSELGKRRRRKQKHSAFTEAKLEPPPDASGPEDAGHPEAQDTGEHDGAPQPYGPAPQSTQSVNDSPVGKSPQPRRGRPPAQPVQSVQRPDQSTLLAPQLNPATKRNADANITGRDAQMRALLHRVNILEQHCLAHGIDLPYTETSTLIPVQDTVAAADKSPWETGASLLS